MFKRRILSLLPFLIAGLAVTPAGRSTAQTFAKDSCLSLSVPIWTNNQVQFTLRGEYGIRYIIESSADLQNWRPVATNSDFADPRVITLDAPMESNFYRAARGLVPMFVAGLVVKQGISLNGNNINVDAYDSADATHFPNGLYNSTNAVAGGDMATETGIISVQSANIHGRLLLAPGAAYSIGAIGLVGDMPANWPTQSGVEGPDWVVTNFAFCLPDVSRPYSKGLIPAITNGSYFLTGGTYYINGNVSAQTVSAIGVNTLYVSGNLSATAISIANDGSSLRLYAGQVTGSASSVTFGNIHNGGDAHNLQFFGLPTCTTLVITGTNGYLGTIYAPEVTLTINVGGNFNFDYQGACVVKSFTANGHFNFHFDQNLKRTGPCARPPTPYLIDAMILAGFPLTNRCVYTTNVHWAITLPTSQRNNPRGLSSRALVFAHRANAFRFTTLTPIHRLAVFKVSGARREPEQATSPHT